MHSNISKKDHEHRKNFPVIIVLYDPYNQEKDTKDSIGLSLPRFTSSSEL